MLRRSLAASILVAVALSTGGCQTGQSARTAALSMLSDEVKAGVGGYLADLDGLVAVLGEVTDLQSALATAPKLAPYVTRVQDGYRTLSSLDPDTLKTVRTAFSPELRAAAEGFAEQTDRLAEASGIGSILKPILREVAVFE
jgi:hypothetical protein